MGWFSKKAWTELRALDRELKNGNVKYGIFSPPRFAIADCFVAGAFDETDVATIIERQTIALAQIRGVVKVVYGGPGNIFQSHLLCWDNRNATIASQVLNVVFHDLFQLILAGLFTPHQEILISKRHQCNGERVWNLIDLLRRVKDAVEDDLGSSSKSDGSQSKQKRCLSFVLLPPYKSVCKRLLPH